MRAVIVCLLIASCAFAIRETVKPSIGNTGFTLAEMSKINQLKQTKWGNIFITLAEMQVSVGPIEKLVQALEDLVTELTKSQDDENTRYGQKQATHEANVQTLTTQINEANNEINNNKLKISNVLVPRKDQAEADIERDTETIAEKHQSLSDAADRRQKEHNSFLASVDAHNEAISAADECIGLVSGLLNGTPSLLEVRKASISIKKLEAKLRATHATETPLIQAMIALATSQNFADSESVNKVLSLLQDFRGRLAKSLEQEHTTEAEEVAAYAAFVEQTNSEIAQLTANINTNTVLIADTEREIDDCNNVILTKTAEELNLKETLDAENEAWRKETATHEEIVAEILREIDVIRQCHTLFQGHNFSAYASKKMGN